MTEAVSASETMVTMYQIIKILINQDSYCSLLGYDNKIPSEDWDSRFLRNIGSIYKITRGQILEDHNHQIHIVILCPMASQLHLEIGTFVSTYQTTRCYIPDV
jgi:hypothetical protein